MTDDQHSPDQRSADTGAKPSDVNDRVVEEWVEETTAFERVHEVARRTYDPQSADRIGERARVSPTTARKHLRALVRSGDVTTVQDGQTTCYRRSETAIVTEHAQSLLSERTLDEIASGIADVKATLRAWREEYGVESPEEFARELDVDDADGEYGAILTEWQTTRRNLVLAEAALAIGEARRSGVLTEVDGDDESSIVV
jgi:DNA-binding MarR family transcriptional regulator